MHQLESYRAVVERFKAQGRITFGPRVERTVELTKVTPADILGWIVGQANEVKTNYPRLEQVRICTAARRKGVKLKTKLTPMSVICTRVE